MAPILVVSMSLRHAGRLSPPPACDTGKISGSEVNRALASGPAPNAYAGTSTAAHNDMVKTSGGHVSRGDS